MLEKLKNLIGLTGEYELDSKLTDILDLTTQRLKRKIGGVEVPEDLNYIIIEVAVKRFNRIGSEGLKSHSVEGESLTFSDDDFAEFESDIKDFLNSQKENKKGKVRFI